MDGGLIESKRGKFLGYLQKTWPTLSDETREDIASFAVVAWLGGRDLRTAYRFIVIDYLRQNPMRHKGWRSGDAMTASTSLDTFHADGAPLEVAHVQGTPRRLPEPYFKHLNAEERLLIKLRYEWGFTTDEIGDLYGLTAERISQKIARAEGILSSFPPEHV